MSEPTIFSNARIVLRDAIVAGSVVVADGVIRAIDGGPTAMAGARDLDGALLLPGLIELHTDNLEKHLVPRPGVHWPLPVGAALAHDLQIAGAGITTVYDAISVGSYRETGTRKAILGRALAAITQAHEAGLLRADHLLHLRCEISDPDLAGLLDDLAGSPLVRLLSVMDHTPGQRQWRDLAKMKQYHRDEDMPDDALRAYVAERQALQARHAAGHRRLVVALGRRRGLPMASHDDTTVAHVDAAVADGIAISEFPTTHAAAAAARKRGMKIVMGAPNVVRGGSHSGNVSAVELARDGLLDGLSSDYVPASLLQSAILLHRALGLPLNETVALVSANIADMLGLDDRGAIEIGRRADLVQVALAGDVPVVRAVWRAGRRVC